MNKKKILLCAIFVMSANTAFAATEWLHSGNFYDGNAPGCAGVYVIQRDGENMYIGRSKNIHYRLQKHYAGQGSKCVDSQRAEGGTWTYRFTCIPDPEQAEAQLIESNHPQCNLRGERDPAD